MLINHHYPSHHLKFDDAPNVLISVPLRLLSLFRCPPFVCLVVVCWCWALFWPLVDFEWGKERKVARVVGRDAE